MLLMALDHVRDFVGPSQPPEMMDDPGLPLFLTRWVTHFCAPIFVLLAGVSAYLYGAKRTRPALTQFLVTRGAWLIFLELTIIAFAWTFVVPFTSYMFLQVIFVIGAAMIGLAGLIWLPRGALVALTAAAILAHDALAATTYEQGIRSAELLSLHGLDALWTVIHAPFVPIEVFGVIWFPIYALLPWVFVLALGYLLGPVFTRPAPERARACLRLGLGVVAAFLIVRGLSIYGDPRPFAASGSAEATFIAFLNTTKYPPSLQFLLMTIGPALVFLGLADRANGRIARVLTVFGSVPLFYYVLHIALSNAVGGAYFHYRHGIDRWIGAILNFQPPDLPVDLLAVYAAWAGVVLTLYPLCRWYAGVKRRGDGWWWSYL